MKRVSRTSLPIKEVFEFICPENNRDLKRLVEIVGHNPTNIFIFLLESKACKDYLADAARFRPREVTLGSYRKSQSHLWRTDHQNLPSPRL